MRATQFCLQLMVKSSALVCGAVLLVSNARAADWTSAFRSDAAASGCTKLIDKAREDNSTEVRRLADSLERLGRTLITPDARVLAQLCLLQAWSTLSTTDPQRATAALQDARSETGTTESVQDALTLSAAVWAIHDGAPNVDIDGALDLASKLDGIRLDRAAAVQGLRAQSVASDLTRVAFSRRLRSQGLLLANAAIEASRIRYGVESANMAQLRGRLARYVMADDPQLARDWGEQALRTVAAVEVRDHTAVPLHIVIPRGLLARANALELAEERAHWLRRSLEEATRAAKSTVDSEARDELLTEWADFIEYLGDIDRLPEQRVTLRDALTYTATSPELAPWRARLLVQQAALQLATSEVAPAQASIDALKTLTARPSAAARDGAWSRPFRQRDIPRLERGLRTLVDDVATLTPSAPAPPVAEPMMPASTPFRPGTNVSKWLADLGAMDRYYQPAHVAYAFDQVSRGNVPLGPDDRSRVAAAQIKFLVAGSDPIAAEKIAADKRWTPPPIGTKWTRPDQAVWLETLASLAEALGKTDDALARYEEAWGFWQPSPPPRTLALLMQMSRMQSDLKREQALQMTNERVRMLPVPAELQPLQTLIASLTAARVKALRTPEAARADMVLALQTYAGADAPRGNTASRAVLRTLDRPAAVSSAELGVLQQLLTDLVALDDRLCATDPEDLLDHYAALASTKLRLDISPLRDTWQDRLGRARGLSGERDLVTEWVVRAFEAGKPEAASLHYAALQDLGDRSEDVLPRPTVSSTYADRQLALLDAAAAERVLMSNRPERISQLLDSAWVNERRGESLKRRSVYGPALGRTIPSRPDRKIELPTSLVHLLSYAPMLRDGQCSPENLKHPQVAAIVVRDQRIVSIRRVGAVEEIERLAGQWLAALDRSSQPVVESSAGARLYDMLLKQAVGDLGAQELLNLRVESDLPALPWSVMLSQYAPAPANTVPVRLLPSAPMLEDLLRSRPNRGRPIVLAAPAFGPAAPGTVPLEPLRWSTQEGTAVAQRISGKLYSGEQATALELLRVRRPAILHLSTHSQSQMSSALRDVVTDRLASGGEDAARVLLAITSTRVALANANHPGQGLAHGGGISALMFSVLSLNGTQLATLSMCSTSIAGDRVGLAAPSLQWAAHQAGAKSVVASLWDVDDEATAAFMSFFYDAVRRGAAPAQALAQAQAAFRTDPARPDWHAPRRWGAFVVSGTNEPVQNWYADDMDLPAERSRAASRFGRD